MKVKTLKSRNEIEQLAAVAGEAIDAGPVNMSTLGDHCALIDLKRSWLPQVNPFDVVVYNGRTFFMPFERKDSVVYSDICCTKKVEGITSNDTLYVMSFVSQRGRPDQFKPAERSLCPDGIDLNIHQCFDHFFDPETNMSATVVVNGFRVSINNWDIHVEEDHSSCIPEIAAIFNKQTYLDMSFEWFSEHLNDVTIKMFYAVTVKNKYSAGVAHYYDGNIEDSRIVKRRRL